MMTMGRGCLVRWNDWRPFWNHDSQLLLHPALIPHGHTILLMISFNVGIIIAIVITIIIADALLVVESQTAVGPWTTSFYSTNRSQTAQHDRYYLCQQNHHHFDHHHHLPCCDHKIFGIIIITIFLAPFSLIVPMIPDPNPSPWSWP